jgi:hypothetical protein
MNSATHKQHRYEMSQNQKPKRSMDEIWKLKLITFKQ